jgi:hypothetical protein
MDLRLLFEGRMDTRIEHGRRTGLQFTGVSLWEKDLAMYYSSISLAWWAGCEGMTWHSWRLAWHCALRIARRVLLACTTALPLSIPCSQHQQLKNLDPRM